jgi:hypothetical protein
MLNFDIDGYFLLELESFDVIYGTEAGFLG